MNKSIVRFDPYGRSLSSVALHVRGIFIERRRQSLPGKNLSLSKII
jgi:hypothetical protein